MLKACKMMTSARLITDEIGRFLVYLPRCFKPHWLSIVE